MSFLVSTYVSSHQISPYFLLSASPLFSLCIFISSLLSSSFVSILFSHFICPFMFSKHNSYPYFSFAVFFFSQLLPALSSPLFHLLSHFLLSSHANFNLYIYVLSSILLQFLLSLSLVSSLLILFLFFLSFDFSSCILSLLTFSP